MSTTTSDPIADMLARIRNAIAVNKNDIVLPHSNVKEAIANILKQSRFIRDVNTSSASIGKSLRIVINEENANAKITEIIRVSKPGRRQYAGADEIPSVKGGRGIVIVSTSKGIMTGIEAKKQHLGGELICKVY